MGGGERGWKGGEREREEREREREIGREAGGGKSMSPKAPIVTIGSLFDVQRRRRNSERRNSERAREREREGGGGGGRGRERARERSRRRKEHSISKSHHTDHWLSV